METLKIVLAMLALVLIGFIGGFVTHRHLAIERIHQSTRHPGAGIERHLERIIQPDDAQREQLQPIFEKWRNSMRTVHKAHMKQRSEKVDSMFLEMKPLLNPTQLERTEAAIERHRERAGKGRPPHPPPPRHRREQ